MRITFTYFMNAYLPHDDIQNIIDVGNAYLIVTINIGTMAQALVTVASQNDVNHRIDIGNTHFAIQVDISAQCRGHHNLMDSTQTVDVGFPSGKTQSGISKSSRCGDREVDIISTVD